MTWNSMSMELPKRFCTSKRHLSKPLLTENLSRPKLEPKHLLHMEWKKWMLEIWWRVSTRPSIHAVAYGNWKKLLLMEEPETCAMPLKHTHGSAKGCIGGPARENRNLRAFNHSSTGHLTTGHPQQEPQGFFFFFLGQIFARDHPFFQETLNRAFLCKAFGRSIGFLSTQGQQKIGSKSKCTRNVLVGQFINNKMGDIWPGQYRLLNGKN